MSTLSIQASFTPAHPALRLTRRGRLVVLALFVGLALAVSVMIGGQSTASGERGPSVPTRTVVVTGGDTLWAIAAEVAEPGGTRAMVDRIVELNALDGASLRVGQQLAVPLG